MIWVVTSVRRPFVGSLLKSELQNLFSDVVFMSENECMQMLKELLMNDGSDTTTVVADIYCTVFISFIIDVLGRILTNRAIPIKIVLISSTVTWTGSWSSAIISDVERAFYMRVPLQSANDLYELENQVVQLSKRYKLDCSVISTGLIYGRDGMDLGEIFRFIWKETNAEAPETDFNSFFTCLCGEGCRVPVIHCDSFLSIVTSAVNWSKRETSIILAVEKMEKPLADVLTSIDNSLNGHSLTRFKCSEPEGIIDVLGEDVAAVGVWLGDMSVAQDAAVREGRKQHGLEVALSDIWKEFIEANGLQSFAMLVAGPPSVGKSEVAKLLSQRLEIQLVSAARAVLYVLRTDIQNEKSAHLSANILEMLQEAKGAVVSALRAKMNEGAKKGAKGAPAPADDVPVDESLVTESFCRTLPPLVSRQCVAFQLKLDPLCSRKGFVLDAWDDCIVSGAESLQEIMMNAFGDHEPLEPSDGDGSGSEVAAGPAPRRIDFVLELQCPSTFPTERLSASLGAQMKAKESQAQIKALEALVAAYSAKLKNVQTSASGEESSTSSHEGVIGIADSYGCLVHRAVINGENSIALVDESFSKICESFPVGWITRGNESGAFDSVIAHGECEEAAAGSQTAATESTVLESAAAALEGNKMLAEQLQKLNAEKAAKLKTRAAKLQAFLTATVMSQVTEGMITILREQPADPIRFLSEHLARNSAANCAAAEEAASVEFQQLLHGH